MWGCRLPCYLISRYQRYLGRSRYRVVLGYNNKGNSIRRLIFMLLLDRSLEHFLTTFHEISHFIILLVHMAKCQLDFTLVSKTNIQRCITFYFFCLTVGGSVQSTRDSLRTISPFLFSILINTLTLPCYTYVSHDWSFKMKSYVFSETTELETKNFHCMILKRKSYTLVK